MAPVGCIGEIRDECLIQKLMKWISVFEAAKGTGQLTYEYKPGQMSNLKDRGLKKAYAKCPNCGRVLKVRVSREKVDRDWKRGVLLRPYDYHWILERVPKHKHYNPDRERLKKLILKGKAPNEHPWCHVRATKICEEKPKTRKYGEWEHWHLLGWR